MPTNGSTLPAGAMANGTSLPANGTDHPRFFGNSVWLAIDTPEEEYGLDYTAFMALVASIPLALLLCCACAVGFWCGGKRCSCGWRLVCYRCGNCCRWLCCRRPLAEQEELARGPDQAIDEHQDENTDVDSIDEPVRRTPPVTDGEDDDDDEAGGRALGDRACCSAVADALAVASSGAPVVNGAGAIETAKPAPAPAPKPPTPSSKAKGKRVVAFKQ